MSKILYIDTDGTKGTLPEGWLGYDAYAAGGDEGRVGVGTSSGDVLLAKKSEVDSVVDGTTDVVYDNTISGLTSTTVKDAIDEVKELATQPDDSAIAFAVAL